MSKALFLLRKRFNYSHGKDLIPEKSSVERSSDVLDGDKNLKAKSEAVWFKIR